MTIKATAASLFLVLCTALLAPRVSLPTPDATYEIAKQGFVYGLPIVMNYGVMYAYAVDSSSGQLKAPFNELHGSTAWLDVRAEPIVLSVPEATGRDFSVQLTDGNTFNFGDIGTQSNGTEAGDYMIAGPDWTGDAPPGIKRVFWSSTQFPVAQLYAVDTDNATRVPDGLRVRPLSAFLNTPAPPPAPPVEFPKIDKELSKTHFFEYLDFVLQFAPPGPEEKNIRAQLARIGVGPGKTMALAALSPDQKADVARAMKDAETEVEQAATAVGKSLGLGDRAFYQGNWLLRAAIAKAASKP